MSPGTEIARYFCAGIGPLQLGVVLVFIFLNVLNSNILNLIEKLEMKKTSTLKDPS